MSLCVHACMFKMCVCGHMFVCVCVAVDISTLTQDQLTSHHTKLFAAPNHLTPDPWADNNVYLIDSSWTVRNVFVHEVRKCPLVSFY